MRFGLFYEHQIPREPIGDPVAEEGDREPGPANRGGGAGAGASAAAAAEASRDERLLADALDQIELADRLGYDYVWEVEHHFLEEYSHSSAPEVFLAAASQRTSRIRLGHGIVQLPPQVNHPARVAERAATLDLLSGGRVELGTGEGSSQMELGGFGVPREHKRAEWEEAIDALTRMMVERPFAGYDGRWVSMPPRDVLPKPKQQPHPPLWVACSRRETILTAAERGIGALTFAFVEPEQAAEWVEEYYAIIESDRCRPAGFAVNPSFAVVLPMMCHEDEATAIERGIDGAHFFGFSLAYYYAFGEHRPGRSNVWEEFQRRREEVGFAREIVNADEAPLGVKIMQQGLGSLRGAIGTPAQITELVERYEKAGVDQVIFVSQAGANRHEHICESLELFAAEVMPRFAGRAEEHETAKLERLGPAIDAALARREPPREADPAYVVKPNGEPAPADALAAGRRGRRNDGSSIRDLARRAGPAALAVLVRDRSDARIERLFGRGPGLAAIFKGMERAFEPDRARGFEGEIQYELLSGSGARTWTVQVADGRARAREGAADAPVVTMRTGLADFIRIAAEQAYPPKLLLEGRMEVEGDFALAARLAEMFGGQSPT